MSDPGVISRLADKTPWLRGLPREVKIVAAIAFFVALGFGIVIPTIPVFAKSFGVSAFFAVAVVSVFALMRLIGAPLAGSLMNRMGERKVLSAGLIIVAVSSAVAGLSQAYYQLLLLRGIGGLGSAMFTVSALALLLRTAGPANRGRAASAFQAGFLLGAIAGPAIGAIVVGISIRAPFFFYAGTLAIATVVAMRYLHTPEQIQAAAQAAPATESEEAPEHARSVWRALRTGAYRAALMGNLTNGWVAFGLRATMIPLFVIESMHRDLTVVSIGVFVGVVFQGIALVPAGRISDHRGRRPAMTIGVSATLVGMIALALDHDSLVLFFISMAILGIGSAFLGSAPAAVVGDIVGNHRGGQVVAIYQMVSDVGSIVGPLVAGVIADHYGYNWAFSTGVAISIVALIFALVMPETLSKSGSDQRPGTKVLQDSSDSEE